MALRLEDGVVERPTIAAPRTKRPGPSVTLLVRLVVSVGAGAALALAFPPYGWAWIAPFAAALLTLLCTGLGAPSGALVGFAYGMGFFALHLQWVRVIGSDGWLALTTIEAVFMAGLGAAFALVTRLRAWPLWTAALWVAVELARSTVPLGGFPWGRLAYALDDTPLAALASLGGIAFVTFVAALIGNLALWAVLARRRWLLARGGAVVAAAALAFGGLLVPMPSYTSAHTATVAIVQGNVPSRGLEFLGRARTVTRNHLAATEELMREVRAGRLARPEFVVWPENSTDIDPYHDPLTRSIVERAVQVAGVPVLVGAILNGPGPDFRRTSGVVWDPETGPGEIYVKQHPVPFGEYIPFRKLLLPYIDRLQMVGRDTYAGKEPGFMSIAGHHIAEVICFEIAYDGVVREVARGSSQLLVVQTNNSTYLGTGQPQQQFAITRLRSIEYGKTTLVASPSGVSGVIAPDGRVVVQSKEATRQVYVQRVPLRTTPTLAARVGALPELLLTVVGLGGIALAVRQRRRARRVADSTTQAGGPAHE